MQQTFDLRANKIYDGDVEASCAVSEEIAKCEIHLLKDNL